MSPRSDAACTCPVEGCEYGAKGGRAVFRGKTMKQAIRARDEHLRSAHPGFTPPKGSTLDKRARLN